MVTTLIGLHVPIVRCNRWRSVVEITRQASCDCVVRTQKSGPSRLLTSVFSVSPWFYSPTCVDTTGGSLRSTASHPLFCSWPLFRVVPVLAVFHVDDEGDAERVGVDHFAVHEFAERFEFFDWGFEDKFVVDL